MLFSVFLAPRAHPDGHYGVDLPFDLMDQFDDFFYACDRHLDFHDGRENFFVENVLANFTGGDIAHQGGDRILFLERHAGLGQSPRHALDFMKAHAHAGPAKFDGEAGFAALYPATHVIGLHFLGAPALDAGGFMGHARIGEGAAHYPRPHQLLGLERRGGTDIRLRVEAQAHHLKQPAHHADECGVQVLLAHAVEAGVTFDAFVVVHRRPLDHRIDINRAHGADVGAVATGHTLVRIDSHGTLTPRRKLTYHIRSAEIRARIAE